MAASESTCSEIDVAEQLELVEEHLENYNGHEAFELLEKIGESVPSEMKASYLLKKSTAAYIVYNKMSADEEEKRMQVLKDGLNDALQAKELESSNVEVLKQCAIMCGTLAEMSPMRQKVNLGFEFKKHLDTALELDPDDFSLLHMRGRFLHQVAGLSWIEKAAARVVFGKMPEASHEAALRDLLKADEQIPSAIDNLLYIGRAYYSLHKKEKSKEYLNRALAVKAIDTVDKDQQEEAKELLDKLQ